MQNKYRIANNYGTAIFQGDLVQAVTGGGVERYADGGSGFILGVFNGCRFTDPTTGKETFSNHYPASRLRLTLRLSSLIASCRFRIQADAAMPVADLRKL